jgi:hypothetical protein
MIEACVLVGWVALERLLHKVDALLLILKQVRQRPPTLGERGIRFYRSSDEIPGLLAITRFGRFHPYYQQILGFQCALDQR